MPTHHEECRNERISYLKENLGKNKFVKTIVLTKRTYSEYIILESNTRLEGL